MNLFNKFRHSFQVKIISVSIFFMLLICVSLTVYYVRVQRTSQNEALIGRADLLARTLAHSAKVGIFSENADILKDPMDGVVQNQEVAQVVIFNSEGQLLAQAKNAQNLSSTRSDPWTEKMEAELIGQLKQSRSVVHFSSREALQVWTAVFSTAGYITEESLFFKENDPRKNASVIGFVGIILSKEILNRQIYGFLLKAVLMALAATMTGCLVIFLVIRGINRPLNRLAQGIKALGSDGATENIPVDTEDEIGRLAMAFNEMSAALRERKAENISLEMQLRQVQKLEALGTLAGGIAHDFNNVLSPIIGYSEMAMEDLPKDTVTYNDLQEVYNAAIRARDLVKQILAFSRQAESERVPLKVQLIVKEVLKLLRATLPSTISLTRRIDDDCGAVQADPTDIHRIVMNLCTNAFHAMRDTGGDLMVALEKVILDTGQGTPALRLPPGEYLKLTVRDTGAGMDETIRQRIFDPYFTTKLPGEGTGMGLAVVHGIVKSYNGDIVVHSEPGKGSTFELFLPRIESHADPTEAPGVGPVVGGHERILLVDDEVQIAYMMKQMLSQLGYHVTTRTSSIEALEAFASHPERFDLVITDQTMPNMTGDKFALELMRIRNNIPVIICTGFSEKINAEQAKKMGVRALIMKPVIKREMAGAIREVLDGDGKQV